MLNRAKSCEIDDKSVINGIPSNSLNCLVHKVMEDDLYILIITHDITHNKNS